MKKLLLLFSLITLAIFLSSCDEQVLNTDHTIYNSEVDTYITIKPETKKILNFENILEEVTYFNIFLNKDTEQDLLVDINFENIINEITTFTNLSLKKDIDSIKVLNNQNIGGNGLNSIFLEVHYKGEGQELKVFNSYEKVIQIDNNDIHKNIYNNNYSNEDVNLNIEINEFNDFYNVTYSISSEEFYHLDIQTFLVSDKGRVYSFTGIYNYYSSGQELEIKDNYIYKEMDIVYIYLRMNQYDINGNLKEIYTRYLVE